MRHDQLGIQGNGRVAQQVFRARVWCAPFPSPPRPCLPAPWRHRTAPPQRRPSPAAGGDDTPRAQPRGPLTRMHADIIAFPCNQFGSQESKCDVDIKEFAKKKGAMFTMMSKIDVVCCRARAVLAHGHSHRVLAAATLRVPMLSCTHTAAFDARLAYAFAACATCRTEEMSTKCIPTSKTSLVAAARSCGTSAASS